MKCMHDGLLIISLGYKTNFFYLQKNYEWFALFNKYCYKYDVFQLWKRAKFKTQKKLNPPHKEK